MCDFEQFMRKRTRGPLSTYKGSGTACALAQLPTLKHKSFLAGLAPVRGCLERSPGEFGAPLRVHIVRDLYLWYSHRSHRGFGSPYNVWIRTMLSSTVSQHIQRPFRTLPVSNTSRRATRFKQACPAAPIRAVPVQTSKSCAGSLTVALKKPK
ncbi:hypothetical protein C8Q76DRAFT_798150 [Earliella scabrosa]|nr:hypothetical protein C8Q76DRAFT_798150 [Earliella scabrosa]